MRVKQKNIPSELKRIVNAIIKNDGDCERWLKEHNKNPHFFTLWGIPLFIGPLYGEYGSIGYEIEYNGYSITVDNDFKEIDLGFDEDEE